MPPKEYVENILLLVRRNSWVLVALIILCGCFPRFQLLFEDISWHHAFRQAHVASNIEYFMQHGFSVTTEMYVKNNNYKVYDFPLYQMFASSLCSITGLNAAVGGRLINIGIYVFTSLVIYRILSALHFTLGANLLALSFYAASPLAIFYDRGVIPDNLAIMISLGSLWCFIKWAQSEFLNFVPYWGMLLSGIISTLIKNPIYLPIVLAVIFYCVVGLKFRQYPIFWIVTYLAVEAITVVGFTLYSNAQNVGDWFIPGQKLYWFFSSVEDRLNPDLYLELFGRLSTILVNPAVFTFAMVSIPFFIVSYWRKLEIILFGLLLGNLIGTLIFFNVNWIHDYYQLPWVFAICAFGGYFVDQILSKGLRAILVNQKVRYVVGVCMLVGIVSMSYFAQVKWGKSFIASPERIKVGQLIHSITSPNDFVFYVTKRNRGWDPSFLYFAKREGINMSLAGFDLDELRQTIQELRLKYDAFFICAPKVLYKKFPELSENVTVKPEWTNEGWVLGHIL